MTGELLNSKAIRSNLQKVPKGTSVTILNPKFLMNILRQRKSGGRHSVEN